MPYSSDVSAGDTTLASQYNNLRADVVTTPSCDTQTRYLFINPAIFNPLTGTTAFTQNGRYVAPTSTAAIGFSAGINLPHGATITSITLYGYRDDSAASLVITIGKVQLSDDSQTTLSTTTANWTSGFSSLETTGLSEVVNNNGTYSYNVGLTIDANDSASDVYFTGAVITYTINQPLP